jgi:dipeptidase E
MKLVLCSEGFHTPNTVQACVELCGKPQNEIGVAVINEAYAVETGGHQWVLDNLNSVAHNFSLEMDMINLLALPLDEVEARIMAKDVIFVIGGDTDYLMQVFQKTGFAMLLPKLLETKVYVGSSAGSIVMGRRSPTAVRHTVYGESQDFGITDYLNLVDFGVLSHLNSSQFPNNRSGVLDKLLKDVDFPVYALEDDSAVVIDGDRMSLIGSAPYVHRGA